MPHRHLLLLSFKVSQIPSLLAVSSFSSFTLSYPVAVSLEVDPPGNLEDILVGEGAVGVEVVTAGPLQPAHQLPHVSCKAVLGGRPCQPAAPETSKTKLVRQEGGKL